ncbi:MAG TPA: ABC transporter permease, partial [Vicinamibacteria bacterium]|nr:ABC transporter permease [Vicinamibacteria bacterium]
MRAYRLLLRLFPASFQLEYGPEMCAVFARRRRDAGGPLGLVLLWLDTLADVAANATRTHADLLHQDLRYAARTLRRSPGFAATAVAVAGLGVGATTVSFSLIDHVLVRPLPFPQASQLMMLWEETPSGGYNQTSPANSRDWKAMSTSFESMGFYTGRLLTLLDGGEPEQLQATLMSAGLLPTLRRGPLLGRALSEEDTGEGAPGTVLLGHALWTTRYDADPGVLGRTVRLNGEPHTVVGVMPADFHFPDRETQIWTALRFAPASFEDRTDSYINVLARLRAGVTLETARAETRLVAGQLQRAYPEASAGAGILVRPLRDHVPAQSRLLLKALLAAALCVLLIACTNLAGLLVARGAFRRKELAVRTALGAGRERLVRQLLTESLVLAACGGVLGVALAASAIPVVTRLVPNVLPVAEAPSIDLRLLGFAALVTALTGVAFGALPALRISSEAAAGGLREGVRAGSRSERLRSWLVVGEVTASVVLLVGAGLLIRALWRVQQVDPGFRAENVLTLRTALPLPRYEKVQPRHDFYRRVLEEARALPGVTHAAY